MERSGVQEVGVGGGEAGGAGGVLPFSFGGETGAFPAGVGVGFVEAHVADGLVRIDRPVSGERPQAPVAISLTLVSVHLPIERRGPALVLDFGPAVGEPEERIGVAAVVHEFEVLAVGDQAVGELEVDEVGLVDRHLVVPAPAAFDVAEVVEAALEADPAGGWRRAGGVRDGRPVGLAQLGDVRAEDVLDLGDQQLLVLLLVMAAGDDEEAQSLVVRLGNVPDQLLDAAVHGAAEGVDLVVGRPSHQAAVVAADARAERLVVRVHDELEAGVVFAVAAERLQDVLGEEPGGMAEVPPRRADVWHGLDAVVLRPERPAEVDAQRARGGVLLKKLLTVHGDGPPSAGGRHSMGRTVARRHPFQVLWIGWALRSTALEVILRGAAATQRIWWRKGPPTQILPLVPRPQDDSSRGGAQSPRIALVLDSGGAAHPLPHLGAKPARAFSPPSLCASENDLTCFQRQGDDVSGLEPEMIPHSGGDRELVILSHLRRRDHHENHSYASSGLYFSWRSMKTRTNQQEGMTL